jgi:sulfite reductase (NADPH) flavoprotein alpha-component
VLSHEDICRLDIPVHYPFGMRCMRDEGRDLWAWLERGAHIYVCGDALRMAKDVERALIEVVSEHGKRSPEDAARFVAELKKNDRYQVDVY